MTVDLQSPFVKLALVLLCLCLVMTLRWAKKRLTNQPLRFVVVAGLNIVATLVLMAWLGNLSIENDVGERVLLTTDGGSPPRGFDGYYRLTPDETDSRSEVIADPGVIRLAHPNLSELTVKGYGLNAGQWSAFAGVTVIQDAPPITVGPVDLRWNKQLLLGNPLKISGKVENVNGIITVQLLDLVGTVVSVARVKSKETFSLSAIPKAMGHYHYTLQVKAESGEVINDELLPVEVIGAPPAKLLLMQSAPSFESKHLKNWASEQGASLLLLTTISKDKFITQSVNLPAEQQTVFTPDLLADFDLLIMDARALMNLSSQRQQWLQQAVDAGLGLFIIGDSELATAKNRPDILTSFTLTATTNALATQAVVRPQWPGNESELAFTFSPIAIKAKQSVGLVGTTKRPLSLYQPQGLGKVALSILQNRYRWRLNGEMQTYTHYWQWLFSQLARTRSDSRFIAPAVDAIDRVNYRSQICLLSEQKPLMLLMGSSTISLATDRFNPYRQCGFYWPQSAGWQRFELQNEVGDSLDVTHRFTFTTEQWQSWQQHERVQATTKFIIRREDKQDDVKLMTLSPVSSTLYWWLLVLCAGFLWLERKV